MSLWLKWWGGQAAKSDAAFRDDLLLQRSGLADQQRRRQDQVVAEMESMLREQYLVLPDADKDTALLKWLRSNESRVREYAAALVVEGKSSRLQFWEM